MTEIGGIWNSRVYAAPILVYVDFHPNIIHLEMLNAMVALRLWAKDWAGSSVTVYCDKLEVVQVANSGKTRDTLMHVSGTFGLSLQFMTLVFS